MLVYILEDHFKAWKFAGWPWTSHISQSQRNGGPSASARSALWTFPFPSIYFLVSYLGSSPILRTPLPRSYWVLNSPWGQGSNPTDCWSPIVQLPKKQIKRNILPHSPPHATYLRMRSSYTVLGVEFGCAGSKSACSLLKVGEESVAQLCFVLFFPHWRH